MRIEHSHALGQQEAMRRLDQFLDDLVAQPPGGVAIKDAKKEWNGSRLTGSFTAAKGLFGASIRAVLDVTDDRVVVDAELPVLLKGVFGEERIRQIVSTELEKVLQ